MVREPRPGRISLGRIFQCCAGGDNLAAALHRQGECNNHERERACATLCKCNYILLCATRVLWSICEDMCSNCENMCSNCEDMCSNCAPMDPLAVVLAARGGEAEKLHQRRMSAAVKVHVLQSVQVRIWMQKDTKCSHKYTTNNTTISQVCSSYQTQPHLRLIVTSRTFGEYLWWEKGRSRY